MPQKIGQLQQLKCFWYSDNALSSEEEARVGTVLPGRDVTVLANL
jgi:hypothetical protein